MSDTPNESSRINIIDLPYDIIYLVSQYLSPIDLLSFKLTNKEIYQALINISAVISRKKFNKNFVRYYSYIDSRNKFLINGQITNESIEYLQSISDFSLYPLIGYNYLLVTKQLYNPRVEEKCHELGKFFSISYMYKIKELVNNFSEIGYKKQNQIGIVDNIKSLKFYYHRLEDNLSIEDRIEILISNNKIILMRDYKVIKQDTLFIENDDKLYYLLVDRNTQPFLILYNNKVIMKIYLKLYSLYIKYINKNIKKIILLSDDKHNILNDLSFIYVDNNDRICEVACEAFALGPRHKESVIYEDKYLDMGSVIFDADEEKLYNIMLNHKFNYSGFKDREKFKYGNKIQNIVLY